MKVAAIVLLVAGAGWFITQMTGGSGNDIAVDNKQESIPGTTQPQNQVPPEEKIAEPLALDTIPSTQDVAVSKSVPQKNPDQKSSASTMVSSGNMNNNISKE